MEPLLDLQITGKNETEVYNKALISSREKLAVCDVKNLPYMDINRQSISIYGDFVTSLTAYYSCGYISLSFASSVCAISKTDATVTTSPYDFSVNTQIGSRKYHSYQCFQP